jgi:large subunit ribosomal protein L43
MEAHLPAFKEKIPHLEVVTELVRGQHPNLKGIYSKILVTFIFHFNL